MRSNSATLSIFSAWGILGLVAMILAGLASNAVGAAAKKHGSLSPAEEYTVSVEAIRAPLAEARTQGAVSYFVGEPPSHCVTGAQDSTLCVWRLSKRQRGWQPLAKALGTGDRLKLVCEFPANDAPRPADSCSAHSQRSNRGYFNYGTHSPTKRISASEKKETRNEQHNLATQLLAQAKTPFQLSTLVGDVPTTCFNASASLLVCTWKTHNGTYGHGTLAHLIGTDMGNRVTLLCELPRDGSPRGPNSCSVKVGG